MLGEIQRLKAMGFRKKAVARTLGISRNTLKKCWEDPEAGTAPENASGGSPELYRAPWSNGVDWEKVGEAVKRGQALSHYWELFQEGLPVGAPLRLVPYVSFWREYKRRFPQVPLEFHRTHPPGACCETDYKGSRPGVQPVSVCRRDTDTTKRRLSGFHGPGLPGLWRHSSDVVSLKSLVRVVVFRYRY